MPGEAQVFGGWAAGGAAQGAGGGAHSSGGAGPSGGAGQSGGSSGGAGSFNPDAGLVAHFAFDETSGTSALNLNNASEDATCPS